MKKKYYSTLFFDSKSEKEMYYQMLSWEAKNRNNLLLSRLTAPEGEVCFYVFKYDAHGNFSILKNSITVYNSYTHCFAYTSNKAYLSYRKKENQLHYKGKPEARSKMLHYLIGKRFKTKLALDFLTAEDLTFISESPSLIHQLFARGITSQLAAWKYYLKHHHHITGNIDYRQLNALYMNIIVLADKDNQRKEQVDLLFKMLHTSNNIQRDMNAFNKQKNLWRRLHYFERLINSSFLMRRKMNYSISHKKRDEVYACQMQDLLQLRIQAGLESLEPLIPFLPEVTELVYGEVQFHLLNNEVAFQQEGLSMQNCIFNGAGFRNNTKKGEALYFSVRSMNNDILRGTLEVYINEYKPILRQFKSKRNQFDFLKANNKKLPGSMAFLQTTRSFMESDEMRSFFKSIKKHFDCLEQSL